DYKAARLMPTILTQQLGGSSMRLSETADE
ncbi:hypothetical protein LCGC14_1352310, partial [marine sediment metagenome]